MKTEPKDTVYDVDVKHLEEDGFYLPYEKLGDAVSDTIKSLLMDAAISFVTGLRSIPKEELEKLKKLAGEEAKLLRPVWPVGEKTGLEMSGFLNSYCIRYPDMADTLRMIHPLLDAGGHPSDMMATVFTMCDEQGVSGKRIMECVNVGYQMWYTLLNGMLTSRNYDCSTALSFVTPVIAALSKGDSPERIQNALNLSVAGGVMLGRVRSTDDMTNLKSAAAGYATAKSLWCYRMSDVIEAPSTIFTGSRGSWFKVVAPLDRPFKGVDPDEVYQMVEIKSFPCFNCAQAPVECGVGIHDRLGGDMSHIKKIVLRKSAVEARVPFRPDRPKYPYDHPTADHHMEYCVDSGLLYGELTPKHYDDEYIQNEEIRRLIDMTELKIFTDEELAALGGNTGGCTLDVWLDDGTVLTEERKHASGNVVGVKGSERAEIVRGLVERKRKMIEHCYGYDFGKLAEVIYGFENHEAKELIDELQAVIMQQQ